MTGQARASLSGLLRLRAVRERDSRIGLAAALTEERAASAAVAELGLQLAAFTVPAASDLAAFQARQRRIDLIGQALVHARGAQTTAAQLSLLARDRWAQDHARLAAVESLLAQRAAALREERRRREVRELDEIAGELWRRGARASDQEAS